MSNLKQVVYLSQADYEALLADTHSPKQYTKNNKTIYFDEDVLYITDALPSMDDLTGVLPISKGGTGATTLASGKILIGNGGNTISTKTIATSITNDATTIPNTQAIYNYAVPKVTSTDNAIARFDSTGGLIQNSKVILTDDGCITITHTANKSKELEIIYSSTIDFWWGVGTANSNHGMYDVKANKWILLADATNHTWSFDGIATSATKANKTTTANAIAYYTDTTGTFGTKASANGVLYATAANGALQWGTLPIAQGGTGATTAAAASWNLLHCDDPGDLNTAKRFGSFKISSTTTNTPISSMWGATLNITDDNSAGNNGTSGTTWQLAFNCGRSKLFLRAITNTYDWTSWRQFVSITPSTKTGDTTKPVYIANTGEVTACSTYAGGTKVTLNNSDKGASTASFYAPTSGGTNGYILKANGDTSTPTWISTSDLVSALGLSNAMHFLGVTTTDVSGTTANTNATVSINGSNVTANAGDVVLYGAKEYVWGNSKWNLLGDESSYIIKPSSTAYGIAYYTNTTGTLSSTSAGTSGYLLQGNGSAAPSWIQATNSNTASTIVKRDASGNFSAGTITASLNGTATSANKINQTTITALGSFTDDNAFIYTAAGGSNTITDKPTSVDAFGCLSFKTASGWHGQLLVSSNNATGVYWRTASTSSLSGGWKKILDENNYTSYTVKKDGTGASGTWGISITGNAATATKANISTTATAIARYSDATGTFANSTVTIDNYGLVSCEHQANHDSGYWLKYSNTIDFGWVIGSGNVNHGMYDKKYNDWIIWANNNNVWSFQGNAATATTATTATKATLLKPISDTTTVATSTWNIPSGSKQVWGQRFTDSTLKYTPEGGSETTITDSGDCTMWLTPSATTNIATLNVRIDGSWYGTSFYGSGASLTNLNASNISSGTIADARLSSNVVLKNNSNTFSNTSNVAGGESSSRTGTIITAGGIHIDKSLKVGKWTNNSTAIGEGIKIHDLRNITDNADKFGNQAVNWYFDNVNGNWVSIMSMKGWTDAYYAWELAGNANNSLVDKYYVRTMTGTTAGTWHTLAYLPAFAAKGSTSVPVYVDSTGEIKECTSVPDTKNTAGSTNSTSKLFLIGATEQSANPTTNSYQYTYVNNGLLSSTKVGLNASGTEKVRMEWNPTDLSLDFIFN